MPIRIRLALLFATATLVLVSVSGTVFIRSLNHGLETSLDSGLRSRADTLVQHVKDAQAGIDFQDPGATHLLSPRDSVAQVLDPAGRVVESSEEAGRLPLVNRSILRAAHTAANFSDVTLGSEHYRVLTTSVRRSDGLWTVAVASSLEAANDAVERVKTGLLVGGSVAVLLAAIGAWYLASAALRPVERMRRKAAEISEHDATSRLPMPGTRDEIASLASTMNELLARLQGALVRQRAFVADAGHELRTPLAVLRTELELADRPNRSRDDLIDAIRNAALETDRLARLAEALLFLARADDGHRGLPPDIEPLLPILERSAEAFTGRAAARNVVVRITGDRTLMAPLDEHRIRQAVDNLVENALRFAPSGSEVRIDAIRKGSELVITVSDSGSGFPSAFLPYAFERFRRADEARARSDGGSGLGLAIVQAVASGHGGTASAENQPGGGAAVSLHLPAGP